MTIYRISKDCGTGWDDWLPTHKPSWGVSAQQRLIAKSVRIGDVLLHFIDYVHVWAGYSRVIGKLRANDRDENRDWRNALPWVIPIERVTWLNMRQCAQATSIEGLSHRHFHRQVAFTRFRNCDDGDRIVALIDRCAETEGVDPTPEFDAKWKRGAEGYNKRLANIVAKGRCRICRASMSTWVKRMKLDPILAKELSGTFLDAAHIVAHSSKGPMTPDNLRALCPNCHRVVDRLSPEVRKTVLGQL